MVVAAPRSRVRVAIGAVVVLVLVGLGVAVLAGILAPRGSTTVVGLDGVGLDGVRSADATGAPPVVVVHVLGAVASPGIYELPDGARAIDAVAAAGGFAADADRAGINLARVLVDAEQLVVPSLLAGAEAAAPTAASDGRVNLNTADAAALETLPRVGPALAERIIAWREANGGFRSVEDLLGVTGIGDKTFAGLRDLVTV